MSEVAIYKYPLDVTSEQQLALPPGTRPLCVQLQRGRPCLWAEVPLDAAGVLQCRAVWTYLTGEPIPDLRQQYVGTYQLYDGDRVFHVYLELPELPALP